MHVTPIRKDTPKTEILSDANGLMPSAWWNNLNRPDEERHREPYFHLTRRWVSVCVVLWCCHSFLFFFCISISPFLVLPVIFAVDWFFKCSVAGRVSQRKSTFSVCGVTLCTVSFVVVSPSCAVHSRFLLSLSLMCPTLFVLVCGFVWRSRVDKEIPVYRCV